MAQMTKRTTKKEQISTPLDKRKRINEEKARLIRIYSILSKETNEIIDGLISRAAYMKVSLEDYEEDLDQNGYVEKFTQSLDTEPYERERPVARLYNTMNKNYQSIVKQLTEMIPKSDKEPIQRGDGFEDFVGSRDE